MLLASSSTLFACPQTSQTPFSTTDTSPIFSEPSFGQAPSGQPTFGQSFEENISFELPKTTHSVAIDADQIKHWVENDFEVLHLRGNVKIQQATLVATSNEAIVWIEIPGDDRSEKPHQVLLYLEQDVTVDLAENTPDQTSDRIKDHAWYGRLQTTGTVDLGRRSEKLTASPPTLFNRAQQARTKNQATLVHQAGFLQAFPIDPQGGSLTSDGQVWVEDNQFASRSGVAQRPQVVINPVTGQATAVPAVPPTGFQSPQFVSPGLATTPAQAGGQLAQGGSPYKILLSRRDPSFNLNLKNFVNPNNPNEKVTLLTGGIRLAIETPAISDLQAFQADADRKLYLTADNAVQWQLTLPDGTRRNQFYLEGDVVFSKGSRIINAQRMFYDVESQQGTILKADMRTNVSGINGPVRVKADVVQQLGENEIQAYGTAVTTSRLGVPRYWLQSEALNLQQTQVAPVFDPTTGVAAANLSAGLSNFQRDAPTTEFTLDGQRNRIYAGGVPVFGWPRIRSTLSNPTLYLENFNINSDRIFGTQIRTGWDIYQILGIQPAAGTEWVGNVDYLSERGFALGSEFKYQRNGLFGIPGRVTGFYDSWYIDDDGTDNLGIGRSALIPEEDIRGRTILQHRHDFAPGYQLRAEVGFITDRNFLEQFYEREWDTNKDATTGFWLERNVGTNSYNLTGDLQVNDFFTQTSGLEYRQFKLGEPVFNNRGIWHASAHAGYQRIRQADTPTDPVDAASFDPLAWEADVDGFTAGTRQEIDFPMQIGPAKVVPYLLGDVSYWQEALDGEDLVRAFGQVGVRASVPIWRVDPSIKSILWNVDGLAHKVSFDVDAFFAEASQDLDELTLYNPLDDDAQEHFRRRFAFDTFDILPGGDTPLRYDERFFALRSGLQSNVTAASSEIADDLFAVKLGVRQKWQTKRGLPGQQRIIDWITLDTQATLFPRANRDNFGSDFGQFDYDFRWYVGDRLSFVSDGYFDFFSQGLRTASFGANISRPGNGNAFVGFRTIEGPISSNILSASLTYRLSDKWGMKAGGQIDFGETGTIGQTLSMIYIGESFLWQFGFNFDHSRDNFGFRFGFEPRFTKRPQLFRPGGEAILPAGSRWLE